MMVVDTVVAPLRSMTLLSFAAGVVAGIGAQAPSRCGFLPTGDPYPMPMDALRAGRTVGPMSRTILVGAHLEHADGDPIGLAVELARALDARLVLGAVHVPSGSGAESVEHERLAAEVAE